ncbi:hypothetical protein CEUSTIGMA_g9192.t1 [Chlamydomonas eustigma]|uniref:Lipocalin/cytosolic fatty-acid binding domain-containing protein n=1 Tax=Chlamydomonas eustigma TaxID=1157962 RepID=A0A250XFA6_9CHLO|nr:hypothetical protein CEUSTIGMA_g9192.t1 [Chlamydomonas eustigma]|eukprot:GAX81764.1 hypothetical protein CEUSTIGMA_g9192.t1 [Chlamydomonas eustigma]
MADLAFEQNPSAFSKEKFMGTWHVAHSTLAMWRKDKFRPRIVYGALPDGRWTDEVLYEVASGKGVTEKNITGIDSSLEKATRFRWRGNGLLWLVKCDCEVLAWDPEWQWCVVEFGKTPFTDSGIDVYSRIEGPLPQEKLDAILAVVLKEPRIADMVKAVGGVHTTLRRPDTVTQTGCM